MVEKINGGPAFPAPAEPKTDWTLEDVTSGMSLRDWFAGQALPQVMAVYAVANGHMIGPDHFPNNCAAHAYRIADAMLAERSKP